MKVNIFEEPRDRPALGLLAVSTVLLLSTLNGPRKALSQCQRRCREDGPCALNLGFFLNILVGFTGQISIGHAAFFLFGAFSSAYINNTFHIPVFFAIPLAGVVTALVGLIFGVPAARLKGLYLVIATLAAQYILLDFFSRADWFSGGSVPASANPFSIFGYTTCSKRSSEI